MLAMRTKHILVLLLVVFVILEDVEGWGRRRRSSRRRRWFSRRRRSSADPCVIKDNKPHFDRTLSAQLMRYSAVAYHRSSFQSWSCSLCRGKLSAFTNVRSFFNSKLHVSGYAGYDKALGRTLVVFAGSQHWRNWVTNLRIALTTTDLFNYPGLKVHAGFNAAYKAIRSQLSKILKEIHVPGRAVHVMGHSMGAAIATIAALDLKVNWGLFCPTCTGGFTVHMTNFGSPRVGNKCFASYYSKHVTSSIRIGHKRDIVTGVPLESWGYRHVPRYVQEVATGSWWNIGSQHTTYLGVALTDGAKRRRRRTVDDDEDEYDLYTITDYGDEWVRQNMIYV